MDSGSFEISFCKFSDTCSPTSLVKDAYSNNAIADAWRQQQNSKQQAQWEQVRTLALCILQPHTTHRLKPADIMQFPWDNKQKTESDTPDTTPEPISDEELQRRYKEAAKARGLT